MLGSTGAVVIVSTGPSGGARAARGDGVGVCIGKGDGDWLGVTGGVEGVRVGTGLCWQAARMMASAESERTLEGAIGACLRRNEVRAPNA